MIRRFGGWLRSQTGRDDPVGDFARMCADDADNRMWRSLPDWAWHVQTPLAYKALIRAWREFARQSPESPRYRKPRSQRGNGPLSSDYPFFRAATRAVSPAQRARILERDGFRCRRCGNGPTDARLVVDHIVPVALGGGRYDDNLQTLCEPCNQGKGARLPHSHDLGVRA